MPKGKSNGYQSMMSSKEMHVSDFSKSDKEYSQKFENKTLSYLDRQDRACDKSARKLSSQKYDGRYS